MKLYIGADIPAIPETVYRTMLRSSPRLSQPDRILRVPDGRKLPVLSSFKTSLFTSANRSSSYTVYVIRGLRLLLLGWPEIQSLRLLNQVDSVASNVEQNGISQKRFPTLYSGLGEFKGPPYKIRLQDSATPHSLSALRWISCRWKNLESYMYVKSTSQLIIAQVWWLCPSQTDCTHLLLLYTVECQRPSGKIHLSIITTSTGHNRESSVLHKTRC